MGKPKRLDHGFVLSPMDRPILRQWCEEFGIPVPDETPFEDDNPHYHWGLQDGGMIAIDARTIRDLRDGDISYGRRETRLYFEKEFGFQHWLAALADLSAGNPLALGLHKALEKQPSTGRTMEYLKECYAKKMTPIEVLYDWM